MPLVSIIIPTFKRKSEITTLDSLGKVQLEKEVILCRQKGIAKTRNLGVRKAKGNILVFMDDDIQFDERFWNRLVNVKLGTFIMLAGGHKQGITRVMSIHKRDFLAVGGFDENISYAGEDIDFAWRAEKSGLKKILLPTASVRHKPHKKSRLKVLQTCFEQSYLLIKHPRKTAVRHCGYLRFFFRNILASPKRASVHVLILVTGFFYYQLKRLKF